jgi:hypothetical protein
MGIVYKMVGIVHKMVGIVYNMVHEIQVKCRQESLYVLSLNILRNVFEFLKCGRRLLNFLLKIRVQSEDIPWKRPPSGVDEAQIEVGRTEVP